MSTLIVRDATLAVNGAPETRRAMREFLDERFAEVQRMDASSIAACVEVLQNEAGALGDTTDSEVLLALTILGIARGDELAGQGVNPVACGRRVASRFEQAGDPESALAVIETLREIEPGNTALERDYDSVMRRLGMVHDLAERYFDRATRLLRDGQKEEAVGWFREVLLLDPSRKDVARMIRDLHLAERRRPAKFPVGVLFFLAIPLALAGIVWQDRRIADEFTMLPPKSGELEGMRARLNALEDFVDSNPVWHGAIGALAERSKLRVAVDEAIQREKDAAEAAERDLANQYETANLVYERARMHAEAGDFKTALADFKTALEKAPEVWVHRERAEADVTAIEEYLAEVAPPTQEDEQ